MARSNTGGTRGWLRGKVASDLYQVTQRADGRKVQLVRAVEESRVNNNTLEQALARMRMGLLMGALSDLKEIVDHSWQTIPYGQLSIAHFVKVNMQSVIADCKAHWSGENVYCYPTKGVKQMRIGEFVISSGTLPDPTMITQGVNYRFSQWYPFRIIIGKANPSFGDLKSALGLNAADYITMLMEDGLDMASQGFIYQSFHFTRLYLSQTMTDDTVLTNANVRDAFTYDGNTNFRLSIDTTNGVVLVELHTSPDEVIRECIMSAIIVSRWDGHAWCRNNAKFTPATGSGTANFEYQAPRWVFQSWFPSYDPDDDESGEYPGKL